MYSFPYGYQVWLCVISAFYHAVNEAFTLLECYTVLTDCPDLSIINYQSLLCNIPEKKILNLLNRKLGGPRNRSGRFREDVNKSYKNDQQDATV